MKYEKSIFLWYNYCMRKKLLLHSCCAPCSTSVIDKLKNDYEITVFYFNPNIYPQQEYEKRKQEQIKYLNDNFPEIKIVTFDYAPQAFDKAVRGLEMAPEKGERCNICFLLRLTKTADYAKQNKFDIFTTTLSVSPHKNVKEIFKIGNEIAKRYEIDFIAEDFKKHDGYLKSLQMAKQYGMYRQDYCGCKYSIKNKS